MKTLYSRFKKRFNESKSKPQKLKSSSDKLLYVESIRGIAALIVVFSHIRTAFYPYPISTEKALSTGSQTINELFYGLPLGWLNSGHFAVIIFFVLSGYVLTYRYYESFSVNELQRQGVKRFPRLAIPVFSTVILSFVMISTGMMASSAELSRITGDIAVAARFSFEPSFNSAFYDATLGVFLNKSDLYNPVLWTMPIELIGSFIVFGLAALLSRNRYRWIFYVVGIILLAQTFYAGFIVGMLIADAVHNSKAIAYTKAFLNKGYIFTCICLALIFASSESMVMSGGILNIVGLDQATTLKLWHSVAAILILWLAICSDGVRRFFEFKLFVKLGSLSFALYLLHYLILYSLGSWVFVTLWRDGVGLNRSALIAGVSVLVVTFIASYFWKRYIDNLSVMASRSFANFILK